MLYLGSSALVGWLSIAPVSAAVEQHITGTVDPTVPTISVVVSDTSAGFTLGLGANNIPPAPDDLYVATNNGSVIQQFNIRGTDATGVGEETWTLVTTAPGVNTYNLSAVNIAGTNANTSFNSTLIPKAPTSQQLAYNVLPGSGSVSFRLRMNSPTNSGTLGVRNFAVTIQAVGQ